MHVGQVFYLYFQNDFDEIDMSGEAGCFFRDQKRRIGEYNCILMFSQALKLHVVTFETIFDEVNKSKLGIPTFAI